MKITKDICKRKNTWRFLVLSLIFVLSCSTMASKSTVYSSASDVCPIKVGEVIESVNLQTLDGKSTDVLDVLKNKPTLLIFYRGSWCPYCNTHLGELKTIEPELIELGYQIVAISPDLPKNLHKSVKDLELDYTLLSDSSAALTKSLGLAFKVDDSTNDKLKGYGIDLEKASGEDHRILPVPAAILVDTSGKVDFVFFSPDYSVRIDKSILLAAAKSKSK